MEDKPLVSVVIPAYNAEKWIGDAIDSVNNQTHKRIQLIVINDGSDDNTTVIAVDKHAYVHYEPENKGAASGLKWGFKYATGDYVCWLSADDVWIDDRKIETQINVMRGTGADLSYFNSMAIGTVPNKATSQKLFYIGRAMDKLFETDTVARTLMLMFRNPINGSSVMIRRDAIDQFGTFDPVTRNIDADGDLWMRYSFLGAKFATIDTEVPMVFNRTHDAQCSGNLQNRLYGKDITRIRLLTWMNDTGRMDYIRKLAPLMDVIYAAGYHLGCPRTTRYIGKWIMKNADTMRNKLIAQRMMDEVMKITEDDEFDEDVARISNSDEFVRFKELMG